MDGKHSSNSLQSSRRIPFYAGSGTLWNPDTTTASAFGTLGDNISSHLPCSSVSSELTDDDVIRITEFNITEASNCTLTDDGICGDLPGMSWDFDLDDDDSLELNPEKIIFYPEGYVTPGTIVFNKGDKQRTFILDPLTGLTIPVVSED